jgi:hypothetical protein
MLENQALLVERLEELIFYIKNMVHDGLRAGTIRCHIEKMAYWKYDQFNYTSNGIIRGSGTLVYVDKPYWMWTIHKISEFLLQRIEYQNALNVLNSIKHTDANKALLSFSRAVVSNELEQKPDNGNKTILSNFIRDLNNEPYNAKLIADINGLVLESNCFFLDEFACLRRATVEDLEEPKPVDMSGSFSWSTHSCILEINLILFAVGSIKQIRYKLSSDRIVSNTVGGESSTLSNLTEWKKYYLKREKEQGLISLISKLRMTKKQLSKVTAVDFISIGFERYNESLLEIVKIERRIANVVMGIEALISDSTTELSFKMQTRVSKLLQFFGFNALQVRKDLKEAYAIRSKFAHGDVIDSRTNNRILSIYGNKDDFALIIINYLRIILIMFHITQTDKKAFIELLDDSLIDLNRNQELQKHLVPVQQYILG